MIAFWNRREVYMGYSMTDFAETRSTLTVNQIKYTYRVITPNSDGRGTRGSFGERAEFSHMYYVYVHKKDYEWACRAIRNNR